MSYWPAVMDQVGFEPTTLKGVRACATLQTFAAGIGGTGNLSGALPLSYSGSRRRQESNLRPPDPDVTRAFTTPQTLQSFFSLPPDVFTSLLPSADTYSVFIFDVHPSRQTFREEPVFTESGIAPEPCGFTSRSIRELHHPGDTHPAADALQSKRFRRFCLWSREQADRETGSP
ncbi:MAG TPA: hypothetical protein VEI73_08065 [Candidatus Acidoferrum sp.]|nr:hypothetical protein [Candidatus Acidoferrum sp.]